MPTSWQARCQLGHIAYSSQLVDRHPAQSMPEVGNGHVATVVGSDTIHAAGLFNGAAANPPCSSCGSYRARIPAYSVNVSVAGAVRPGCVVDADAIGSGGSGSGPWP